MSPCAAIGAITSGFLARKIQERTSERFVRDGLTLYADDNLGTWEIRSFADLRRGLREAAVILDTLQECELEVSPEKSVFLLELRGPRASKAYRSILGKLPTGKGVCAGKWRLPLKSSHPYLGVVLSFGNFELMTYQSRKTKAVQTFNRLGAVLRDRRALTRQTRVQLWCSLVRPVLFMA